MGYFILGYVGPSPTGDPDPVVALGPDGLLGPGNFFGEVELLDPNDLFDLAGDTEEFGQNAASDSDINQNNDFESPN